MRSLLTLQSTSLVWENEHKQDRRESMVPDYNRDRIGHTEANLGAYSFVNLSFHTLYLYEGLVPSFWPFLIGASYISVLVGLVGSFGIIAARLDFFPYAQAALCCISIE